MLQAEVKFYSDTENRLRVLLVEAEDPYVRKLLKKCLDDKLSASLAIQHNVYKLPVIIEL